MNNSLLKSEMERGEPLTKSKSEDYLLSMAHDNLKEGKVILFAMSGEMGSGKDTIGDSSIERLKDKYPRFVDLSFGKLIRDEVNYIQSYRHETNAGIQALAKEMSVDLVDIEILLDIIKENSIYQRSDRSRRALQFWGDKQRSLDPDYWIKSLEKEIVKYLANSTSVNVTDIRFPKEVELIKRFPNGRIVRLEVSEKTRVKRIKKRDGIEVDTKTLNHRTETALNEYRFERKFNNEGDLNEVVSEVVFYLMRER